MKNGQKNTTGRLALIIAVVVALVGLMAFMNRASDNASHKAGVSDLLHHDDDDGH